jgi:hypothetical protein
MKVLIHFDIFDIGPHGMCSTDYLILSEIQTNDEEITTTYCGGVRLNLINDTSTHCIIKLNLTQYHLSKILILFNILFIVKLILYTYKNK